MSWEDNVRKASPYVPGEQPRGAKIVKLNTNENPYPPSPKVAEALMHMDAEAFRRYPAFPEKTELTTRLSALHHVEPEQIFVGVGSDDVLSLAFLTFFQGKKPIFFPDITYSFYDVWADLYGIPYEMKPLDDMFRIRPEDYAMPNGGVVFPNPNAPTGVLLPLADVEKILAANRDVVVIVDEAYIDFGGVSSLPLLEKYENLLVVRTFSKSRSMAGVRIGYAVGSPKLISYLQNVKYSVNSYTLNMPALALGAAALADEDYFTETCGRIIATREQAAERLYGLGFSGPRSAANFLFVKHDTMPAGEIFDALREKGVYVRHWNKARIDDYLRITIGRDEEMEALYAALREILTT